MWQQRVYALVFVLATVCASSPAGATLLRCDHCSESQRLAQLPAPMPVPTKYLFADFSSGEVYGYLVAARNAAGGKTPVLAVNDIPEPLRVLAERLARVHAASHGSMQISIAVKEEALQIPSWARLIGRNIPNDAPARSRIEDALRDKGDLFLAHDPALSDMLEIWRSQEGLHSTFPGWLDAVQLEFRVRFADGAEHVFRRDWESDQVRLVEPDAAPSSTVNQ
jgi:hypothetical protein